MSRLRKVGRLCVVVGNSWPEDVDVHVASVPRPVNPDPKSRLAVHLASWACFLMAAFAAYGMFRGDQEILSRVLRLVEAVIAFVGGWIGGRGQGP